MSQADRFGIDLGTTKSVLAMYKGGLRFLRNRQGDVVTPSWVTWYQGQALVGQPAKETAPLAPQSSVFSAKRLMGRNYSDPKVQKATKLLPYKVKAAAGEGEGVLIEVDGQDYQPQDVAALVLGKMKADAEFLNPGLSVNEVIVTVPAYFNESQCAATMEAGRRAAMTVLAVLAEPTAAAYAYGTDPEKHDGRHILVYDLGGGTFDATIIMAAEGAFIQLGLDGDMWLGGDDFDECIARLIVDHIKRTTGKDATHDRVSMMEIRKWAEHAKCSLSDMDQTEIHGLLPNLGNALVQMTVARSPRCPECHQPCEVDVEDTGERDDGGSPVYRAIARCVQGSCASATQGKVLRGEAVESTLEGAIAPLVRRTIDLTDKALSRAGMTDEDINDVLMVGGSTFVPLVRHKVRARFGAEKVKFDVNPRQCVAQGAAIVAMQWPPNKVQCPRCGRLCDIKAATCEGEKCSYRFTREDVKKATERARECPNCGAPMPAGQNKCANPKCGRVEPEAIFTTAHAYGVKLVGNRYGIVLPVGTQYPVRDAQGDLVGTTHRFVTEADNQRLVEVAVYAGDKEEATSNDLMGHVLVALAEPVPAGTPVDVTFALDASQRLKVDAVVKDSKGSKASAVLEHSGEHGADGKSVVDRIREIRQRAGSRITPEHERKLSALEGRAVSAAMDQATDSAGRRDEIEAVKGETEALAEELGVAEERPRWVGEAIGSVNFARLAVMKMEGLIDAETCRELRDLASRLERAVELKDQATAEELTAKIDGMIHDLDRVAMKVLHGYLVTFRVQQASPAMAEALRDRLDHLVPRLAAGSFEAEANLDALLMEIEKAAAEAMGGAQVPTPGGQTGITDGFKDIYSS